MDCLVQKSRKSMAGKMVKKVCKTGRAMLDMADNEDKEGS